MKTISRIFAILFIAIIPVLSYAQEEGLPNRLEITQIEINDGQTELEVFELLKSSGEKTYWLSVGHLGIGDDIIQIQFDPIFELFIPLGDNLEDAQETMETIYSYFKKSSSNVLELQGCLAPAFPNSEFETVKIVPRRYFLSRLLQFKVERDGYIRCNHISRGEFGSLLTGLKLYRKLHPNE